MFLIYNREYVLVGEVNDIQQVRDSIGEDFNESAVNSLTFTRGKTVVTEDKLKNLVNEIVTTEKDLFVGYMTSEIENQEDESVELKTSNRHLQNKLVETREFLTDVSSKLGVALGNQENEPASSPKVNANKREESDEDVYSQGVLEELYSNRTEDYLEELDEETKRVLQKIDKRKVNPTEKGVTNKRSAGSIIANRKRKQNADINFLSIIDGGKVAQLNDLKGKSMVKTTKLADDVGLDREHIEYLIEVTLKECGGESRYQNKSVVSKSEAVWVIVSALTKREGFGNTQRFQKTKENAEDFYHSWDSQKSAIEKALE